jgi:LuxR family transcriptional activator of conjugal transfer of Ti plasmids
LSNDSRATASVGSIPSWLTRIADCRRVPDLAEIMFSISSQISLAATAGGMLTGPKAASADPFFFNNWPATWLDVYRSTATEGRDPIVRWALGSGAPVRWLKLRAMLEPGDPGHAVFELAARHGYVEGYAVPVRTTAGHLGLLSVGGNRAALSVDEQIVLQSTGTAVLNRAEAITAEQTNKVIRALTNRERACVALLVKGLGEPEIAAALGISAVTARFHLDNARTKMRASSRALLAAMMTGLMQIS